MAGYGRAGFVEPLTLWVEKTTAVSTPLACFNQANVGLQALDLDFPSTRSCRQESNSVVLQTSKDKI